MTILRQTRLRASLFQKGRFVIFALDFYWINADGSRDEILREIQQAPSIEIVERRARAILKHVVLRSRRANFCVIKTSSGRVLREIGDAGLSLRRLPALASAAECSFVLAGLPDAGL
jgi:hypothetical protein